MIVVAFVLLERNGVQEEPTSEEPLMPVTPLFPGSASTNRVSVPGNNGIPIEVKDFSQNGESVADAVNPGSYVLAGSVGYCLEDGTCPHGADTDAFSIAYEGSSQSFNIALLKEPLGETREDAEDFLRDRLGISDAQLCSLNYYLGVPYFVNERFSGENLKFSFCTDATTLP